MSGRWGDGQSALNAAESVLPGAPGCTTGSTTPAGPSNASPTGFIGWTSPTEVVYLVAANIYPIDSTMAEVNVHAGEHPATDADPGPPVEGEPPFG